MECFVFVLSLIAFQGCACKCVEGDVVHRSSPLTAQCICAQYAVHRVTASVSGLPNEPFTTEEVSGDRGIVHEWAWLEHVDTV